MRGTAAGFAVGGFGAGSAVWGKVYIPSMNAVGLVNTFVLMGCVMSGTIFLCALIMRTPPPGYVAGGVNIHGQVDNSKRSSLVSETEYVIMMPDEKKHPENYANPQIQELTLLDCLFSADYLCMYLMLFANIAFGLIVLSRLADMVTILFEQSSETGATAVAVNGVFNCTGRLLMPMFSDVLIRWRRWNPPFARKMVFGLTLSVQLVLVATLPAIIRARSFNWFLGEIWLLTFLYGGGFGTIPCFICDMFGAYNIGALHGFILTAWSIAGVAGGLGFTSSYNQMVHAGKSAASAYIHNFQWILGVIICGFVALFFIRTRSADRFAPGYKFTLLGHTLFHLNKRTNN